jgi:hypothetical protein
MRQAALDAPPDVRRLWAQVNDESLHPLDRLQASAELRVRLNTFARQLAAKARDEGRTWGEIGEALEITKQAAQQRFG